MNAAVAKLVSELANSKNSQLWELEEGDAFWQDPDGFYSLPKPIERKRVTIIDAFDADGNTIPIDWAKQKPKRMSQQNVDCFKRTPNTAIVGRNGEILVSRGSFHQITTGAGEHELWPFNIWWKWRKDQIAELPAVVDNRPEWASSTEVIITGSLEWADYVRVEGGLKYSQRFKLDGTLSAPKGWVSESFADADELRAIAARCLAFADALESGPSR